MASTNDTPILVSGEWLEAELGTPGLTILDGSWYLPAQKRDARAEYEAGHIPGAIFFDHDQIVDPAADLPHALPSPREFARLVGALGITADDRIVVYDGPGLFSAPRVRWMFKAMGARNVSVLDGGIDRWKAEGRPVTADITKIAASVFTPDFDEGAVADIETVRDVLESGKRQVLDARPAGRFDGTESEPRAGVRSGHMPGARNVPAASLSRDGSLLPPEELVTRFRDAGVDLDGPVVTTCGSGITAAVVALALESLGHKDVQLYDGSWAEWGSRTDTPVTTGRPK